MKNAYQIIYGTSILVFLLAILGGSVTKPVFHSFSHRTLETAGVKRSSIDSLDSRIDEMVYTVARVQLQIEKLRNLFSDKETDESKYQKQKNEVFSKNIYNPVTELLIIFYRILFFCIGVFMFLTGVIIQLIYRGTELRYRVTALENKLEFDGI